MENATFAVSKCAELANNFVTIVESTCAQAPTALIVAITASSICAKTASANAHNLMLILLSSENN